MSNLKKLTPKNRLPILGGLFCDQEELEQRDIDYETLTPEQFAKKYKYLLFRPAYMFNFDDGKLTYIQYNFCINPFCKWYGLPQHKYINLPNKPSRYKIAGDSRGTKFIHCNEINDGDMNITVLPTVVASISNWSVLEEIKRLVQINKVIDEEEIYAFHKDNCSNANKTPFTDRSCFYIRGKSTSNSTKWQCKECKKITNVLPNYKETHTYKQKENDVMLDLTKLLLSRTPVTSICNFLDIAPKTFYHKLELVYKKTLEFLDKYETQAFKSKKFDEIWINTDQLIYDLNNVRKRGEAKGKYKNLEEKKLITNIVTSSDMFSRYVFRSDIAYDFTTAMEDIEEDTKYYHDDHAYSYQRKNDRLRFPYAPQPPTQNDTQSMNEYLSELAQFERRKQYVEGCHVNSTYTSIAHYWLIKNMVNSRDWHFVSDNDQVLINSIMRVFADEIRNRDADYFLCRVDKTLSKKDAYDLAKKKQNELIKWGQSKGLSYPTTKIQELIRMRLVKEISSVDLYKTRNVNGKIVPIEPNAWIEHPYPDIDEGTREIQSITNLLYLNTLDIADLFSKVNMRSINTFFNMIHRKISILERPLVTSRGEGRTYIYSNYNPRYAQYALTILRTVYNFCWDFKSYSKNKKMTPAQRLGITDKKFKLEDIVYFNR